MMGFSIADKSFIDVLRWLIPLFAFLLLIVGILFILTFLCFLISMLKDAYSKRTRKLVKISIFIGNQILILMMLLFVFALIGWLFF